MTKTIREPFNALSHLGGVVASIAGIAVLLLFRNWSFEGTVAILIFGFGAIFMYGASCVYHWTPESIVGLRKLDHSAIYIMIAACYTPVCVIGLPKPMGWIVLGLQWMLATIGIVSTAVMDKPPTWLRLTLYLLMGWMALGIFGTLMSEPLRPLFGWMIGGGLSYTVGTIFYASQRPKPSPGHLGYHEIWHLFVLVGSGCHLMMMLNLPQN